MADMTLSEAAAECKKFGQLIRAFEKVRETAEALQAVEQNVTERIALRDKLGADIESSRATLTLEIDAVEKARSDAQELIAKAAAEARAIKSDAQASAESAVKAAQMAVDAAGAERAAVQTECAAAKAELESLKNQLNEARQVIERAEATKAALAAVK
jgi:chromosome segregation ATPase